MRPAGTFTLLAAIAAASRGQLRGLVRPVLPIRVRTGSKYPPHQGEREKARRLKRQGGGQ